MRLTSPSMRALAVLLAGFLTCPVHLSVLAADAAAPVAAGPAEIDHSSPGSYYPGFRVNLFVGIEDPAGVRLARCYFKVKHDNTFAFVDMTTGDGGSYQATLPAPWVNSEAVEYVFVVVNQTKGVTRSPVFTIEEEETKEAARWKEQGDVFEVRLDRYQEVAEKYEAFRKEIVEKYRDKIPDWQTDDRSPLKVKTEMPAKLTQLEGFFDRVTVEEVPPALHYGPAAKAAIAPSGAAAAGVAEAEAVSAAEGAAFESGAATTASGAETSSFWGSAWPWVIGGALVAGGGAAAIAGGGGGSGGGGDGPTPCNTTTTAGGDTPESHSFSMGQNSGTFQFDWETYAQADRISVRYEGNVIFDTGCVGASGSNFLNFSGGSSTVTVSVEPNCAGGTGTAWEFTVHCP